MSGCGSWGCEFALRKSYEFSHHTHHQPALAGFGVSDREFIHGAVSDREFIHGAVSDREFVHARRGGLVARGAHRMNSVSDTSNPLKRVALVGTGFVRLW